MLPALATHGSVASGFDPLRRVFEDNFKLRGDRGAAVAAYVDGREVAHLWGGERQVGAPWTEDTLVCGFSTGKGICALAIQMLVDRGQLDIDAPVATFWPEFGRNGKATITTRMFLNHTGGLPWFPDYGQTVSLDDPSSFQRYDEIIVQLGQASPLWEPGTKSGYHSLTMGFLLGEVVRRVTGQRIGEFIRVEIARPLELNYWVGLPETEHWRVAPMNPDPVLFSDEAQQETNSTTPMGKVLLMGPVRSIGAAFSETFNDPAFRAAEVAAAGPHTDARSLARVYAALACEGTLEGLSLVSPETIVAFTTETFSGVDVISNMYSRLGLGYALASRLRYRMDPKDNAFGHPGLGGATAFADPKRRIGFGYVTNEMVMSLRTDLRAQALIDSLYSCVDSLGL